MKGLIIIIVIFGGSFSYAQDDSLRSKEVDEVVVSVIRKKEVAYKDSRCYIMDFQVGLTGTFILLNRFRRYYLYSLNADMEPEIKMEIMFHPKSLYQDCEGFLYLMSKDSMYQFEKQEDELVIIKRYPRSKYELYFKNCLANNSEALMFKSMGNNNQTTQFYQKGKFDWVLNDVYRIEDSSLIRSVKDTQKEILKEEDRLRRNYARNEQNKAPTWENQTLEGLPQPDMIREVRNHLNRRQFYSEFVVRPYYNPLFVKDDTTYIFDHVNACLVRLDNRRQELDRVEISYHQERKWKGEMHLDAGSQLFYTVQEVHGAQIFGLLSMDSVNIRRRTKITRHAYPEKVIIFKGFAYYIYRQNVDDNLNKLFRQRL
ncbi:MAG: hypothetical protein ACI837_000057 [Crocinitomicaceae bacterium]|jgi:hypothetical protein